MNKILVVLGILFTSFILTGSIVHAADEVDEIGDLPKAGLTPNSKLYALDRFFENVSLKLTFSNEKRVEKLSRNAEERLAELNELDSESAEKYSDELFNEYGLNVEKANIYLQQLASEGKIDTDQLDKLNNRVENTEAKQIKLNSKVTEQISQEVQEQVQNAIRNSKMAIFNRFTNIDEIETLHDTGFGYGALLRLQAISELTSKSITELLEIENVVTLDDDGEKNIDFETIIEANDLTQEQINQLLKDYRTEAKDEMKNQLNRVKKNAEQRRNEIKEQVKQRSRKNQ